MSHVHFLLTGRSGSGKTTLCQSLAEAACRSGSVVHGLVSPAHYADGRKRWIEALDLATGEVRLLAQRGGKGLFLPQLAPWRFDEATLAWGNQVLSRALPCDWLIIDELGPLEFAFGLGWQAAFDVLAREGYRQALVTVRPELLEQGSQRWLGAILIHPENPADLFRLVPGLAYPPPSSVF